MMRKPIIVGNWKMNNTKKSAKLLLEELNALLKDSAAEVVVCVPYTILDYVSTLIKGTNIKLGAQNVAWADKGAFTGEISAEMLVELGVEYVIIGHSERRQMFNETDLSVNKKTIQALKNNLKPIVCVGETLHERKCKITEAVVKTQMEGAFDNINAADFKNIVIAYEPIWAIGTGKTATADEAQETIKFIRSVVASLYNKELADAVRIQYGGSMNGANAKELMSKSDIDGGLIGGASLTAIDFSKVVNY